MGTSTNRPKPKSGQSAARNVNGKPSANQEKTGAAEPNTKTTTDASDSSAKTTSTSGALSSTAKTTSGTQSSTSKTATAKPTARATTTKALNKASSASARLPVPPRVQTTKRDQKREELSRKIEERRQQREREQRNKRIRKWSLISIGSIIGAVLVGILIYNLIGPGTPPYLKGDTIDGVQCNAGEQLASHYHAHLQIYVNGAEVPIPTDVGRQSVTGCYYWLHTHPIAGDDGVIHIESPDNRTYSVKQFFDIWGQEISATNLLGHKVDASHKLTAYVYDPTDQPTDPNQPFTVTPPSNLTPYTGDPTKIVLKPHELVVLEYGTSVVQPQAWTFIAGE